MGAADVKGSKISVYTTAVVGRDGDTHCGLIMRVTTHVY
jgi:hypothetical protein